mgnify:FL=1|jgi:hypothetical protein
MADRALFLGVGHVSNELNWLQRVMLFSFKGAIELDHIQAYEAGQAMAFGRIIAGKLHEANGLLRRSYFGTKLSIEYRDRLNPEARLGLDNFNNYFSSGNLVTRIRNHVAFHYNADRLVRDLEDTPPDKSWCLYLSKSNMNSFYSISETAAVASMIKNIDAEDIEGSMIRYLDEVGSCIRNFNDFSQGYMIAFCERYFPENWYKSSAEVINIHFAPLLQEISLPLFIGVDEEEKGQ